MLPVSAAAQTPVIAPVPATPLASNAAAVAQYQVTNNSAMAGS